MSDNIFKWSLVTLSILSLLWMVLGSIFAMSTAGAIFIGLVVWIIGGGILLYYWGKGYMDKL